MEEDQNRDHEEDGGTATATRERTKPARPKRKHLPTWRVLLHNDDANDILYVVDSIQEITAMQRQDAELRTLEAHNTGVALLLVTHRERAELIQEQFASRQLTVTIEPE